MLASHEWYHRDLEPFVARMEIKCAVMFVSHSDYSDIFKAFFNFYRGSEYENALSGKQQTVESEHRAK